MIFLTLSKVSLLPDATADNLPAFTHFPFPETGQARNSEPLPLTEQQLKWVLSIINYLFWRNIKSI